MGIPLGVAIPLLAIVTTSTVAALTLEDAALDLSRKFDQTALEVLKVDEFQTLLGFLEGNPLGNDLDSLTSKLEVKFSRLENIMFQSRTEIESLYDLPDIHMWGGIGSNNISKSSPYCCDLYAGHLRYDKSYYSAYVNDAFGCFVIPGFDPQTKNKKRSQDIFSKVTQVFKERKQSFPEIRWQYHQSKSGLLLEYPASRPLDPFEECYIIRDQGHKAVIEASFASEARYFVIGMDRGAYLGHQQMMLMRHTVEFLLSSMTDRDYLIFTAFATTNFDPINGDCTYPRFVRVTSNVKLKIRKFLNVVQPSNSNTNYEVMKKYLEEVISSSEMRNQTTWRPNVIMISVVDVWDLEEFEVFTPRVVKSSLVLSEKNQDNLNSDLRKKVFLTDRQGLHNVGILTSDSKRNRNQIQYFLPYYDPISQRDMVSATSLVRWHELVLGVTGFDTDYRQFLADLIYYRNVDGNYIFLIYHDSRSQVVFHPKVYDYQNNRMPFVLLEEIEDIQDLDKFTSDVWRMDMGSRKVIKGENTFNATWKLLNSKYFALISMRQMSDNEEQIVKKHAEVSEYQQAVLPVLFPNGENSKVESCQFLKSPVNFQKGNLYLSPTAMKSPNLLEVGDEYETSDTLNNYMAFLADKTQLIANPGLKEGVKADAAALVKIIALWGNTTSPFSPHYILDRYAALNTGISVSYPGSSHALKSKRNELFHSKQWRDSLKYSGKKVFSGPFLHSTGAGYAVSMSIGNSNLNVKPLIALDMLLSALEDMVHNSFPACQDTGMSCFLFDQTGNLIYHPVMTNPSYTGPIVDQHLNHKEPNVGKDLLRFPHMTSKKFCNDLSLRSTVVYYEFNTDLKSNVHSSNWNMSCHKFNITAIPGTSAFIGLVNVSCPYSDVFCPCNINSDECFICPLNQEEAKQSCECPCQCPRDTSPCSNAPEVPVCENLISKTKIEVSATHNTVPKKAQSCFDLKCDSILDKTQCNLFPGCSWCEVEIDYDIGGSQTFSYLKHPFCSELSTCFRGAIGSLNPYERVSGRGKLLKDVQTASRSPIGPLIGGILVFFLCLAASVLCYRQKVGEESCTGRAMFRSSPDQTALRIHTNIEVEEDEEFKEIHENKAIALTAIEAAAAESVISPYRMNPGYRRPSARTDSDNGYSTMTPLGDFDSEIILPYTASGPARDRILRHKPPPSHQSVTSGVSSRTSSPVPSVRQHQQILPKSIEEKRLLSESSNFPCAEEQANATVPSEQTVLHPNQIIVSATVHMTG